jgi:hypothetical protein
MQGTLITWKLSLGSATHFNCGGKTEI